MPQPDRGLISHERLREVLNYNPDTGDWTWLRKTSDRNHRIHIGLKAGTRLDRYWQVAVDRKKYLSHRLAWFYMTGEWPALNPDHIDCDGFNNRWSNLRLATNSENQANRRRQSNNTSGLKGVHWHTPTKTWRTSVQIRGKRKYFSNFKTKEEAAAVYAREVRAMHGEFARTT